MGSQIPLLIIDRRGVSIMSTFFTNRRGETLKARDSFEKIRDIRKRLRTSGSVSGIAGIVSGIFTGSVSGKYLK
jgi:hypothetical protein